MSDRLRFLRGPVRCKPWDGRYAPRCARLRIVTATLFMAHGTAKLFPHPVAMGDMAFVLLAGGAGTLEVFGDGLLLLGLFMRPVAFIRSGEMAFAKFMTHASAGCFPTVKHGEPAVLYCFAFLYLAAAGGALEFGRAAVTQA